MDLPTYTSIWRIEKRLYKLYDFRLPMPLPIGQVTVFAAIAVPYVVLLTMLGLPFNHTLIWLYVLPPGLATWLATRPVIESKRLPELVKSQLRYLAEPRVLCRMSPLSERDVVVVTGRVWRPRASRRAEKALAANMTASAPAAESQAAEPLADDVPWAESQPAAAAASREWPAATAPPAPPATARRRPLGFGRARVLDREAQSSPGNPGALPAWVADGSAGHPAGPPSAWASGPLPVAPAGQPARSAGPLASWPSGSSGRAGDHGARPVGPPPGARLVARGRPAHDRPAPAWPAQDRPAQDRPAQDRPSRDWPRLPEPPAARPAVRPDPAAERSGWPAPYPAVRPDPVAERSGWPAPRPAVRPEPAAERSGWPVPRPAVPPMAASAPRPAGPEFPASEPVPLEPAVREPLPADPVMADPVLAEPAMAGLAAREPDPSEPDPSDAGPSEPGSPESVAPEPGPPEPAGPELGTAQPIGSEPPQPAAATPSAAPQRPAVTVVGAGAPRATPPAVERALAGPSARRGDVRAGRVSVVPGGHRPGKPDLLQRDRARAQLPIGGPARIVVLGCTVGAGQTVTALLTGEVLASLRADNVAVLDLNPGAGSLARRAESRPALSQAGSLGPSRLVVVVPPRPGSAGPAGAAGQAAIRRDPAADALAFSAAGDRHDLVLADPATAAVPRLLAIADQLILVAPASAAAPGAIAMTFEWLEAHGQSGLAAGAVMVLNGVSRRSAAFVEQSERVCAGRCRAIVRVPWDDQLQSHSTKWTHPAAPGSQARQHWAGLLSPATAGAYTALAGVLVAGLADRGAGRVSEQQAAHAGPVPR